MEITKYQCTRCFEHFSIAKPDWPGPVYCPRCGAPDVPQEAACSLEVGPPPWDFKCEDCGIRFTVQSPGGPDELASLICPVCRSRKIKWLALSTAACGSGG